MGVPLVNRRPGEAEGQLCRGAAEKAHSERWRWRWLTGWVCCNSVKSQMVNIPSFLVRVEQEKHIEFALTSPYGPGRPGRVKRKMMAAGGGGGDADDE